MSNSRRKASKRAADRPRRNVKANTGERGAKTAPAPLKADGKKEKKIMRIKDLKQDKNNARQHNPRNIEMIEAALREVGAARSGVIDEDGRVLAGNATLEALTKAGIGKVKVVDAKGDEWVVVRRSGLTEEQKKKLAIYDNRTSELAEWDLSVLENLNVDLSQWFLPYELTAIGASIDPDNPGAHWAGMPEFHQEDQSAWKSLKVNFKCAEDMAAFAALMDQNVTEATRSIWFPHVEPERVADKRYTSES